MFRTLAIDSTEGSVCTIIIVCVRLVFWLVCLCVCVKVSVCGWLSFGWPSNPPQPWNEQNKKNRKWILFPNRVNNWFFSVSSQCLCVCVLQVKRIFKSWYERARMRVYALFCLLFFTYSSYAYSTICIERSMCVNSVWHVELTGNCTISLQPHVE